ncbi:MAG: hypothetical protein WC971_05175 [Coriobacteriia bacterium]
MRAKDRPVTLAASLAALTLVLYAGMWLGFPHRHTDTVFYSLLDLAFIPVSVLIVGLIINRLLAMREKRSMLHKLNMVIGAFFAEVGTDAIGRITTFDTDPAALRSLLRFSPEWTPADFARARAAVASREHRIDSRAADLADLRDLLVSRRSFLLGLLENPNLLEHESFTELLWALFHLSEELAARSDLSSTSEADHAHLTVDMRRAYSALLGEWVSYLGHLQQNYPFLYSFAVRTNPFDPDAAAEVG